ncbi:MAG: hypothetical protein KC502_13920 [Myxococcales bacterium]|nr:hypothetical protein [Myxococcales bacterium]
MHHMCRRLFVFIVFALTVAGLCNPNAMAIGPAATNQASAVAFNAAKSLKSVTAAPVRSIAAVRSKTFKGAFDLTLSPAPKAGAKFKWHIESQTKGLLILSPNGTTSVPTFTASVQGTGQAVVQVLFTMPGERVIAYTARISLGGPKPVAAAQAAGFWYLSSVGEDVVVDMRAARAQGAVAAAITWGDGSQQSTKAPQASHRFTKVGDYRVTIDISNGKIHAVTFMDVRIVAAMPPSNPCTAVGSPASPAFNCATGADYAVCMVFLRAASGDYACFDAANPFNDATKFAAGAPPSLQQCAPSADLPAGGFRCFTERAGETCRRIANGHRHIAGASVRHCQTEGQPATLSVRQTYDITATLNPTAYWGADFTDVDGILDVLFNNPGAPPRSGNCNQNVANWLGRSCVRRCRESYYTYAMSPSGPMIPVIWQAKCSDTLHIRSMSGVGDDRERAAAACQALLATSPPGTTVGYDTHTYMEAVGVFVWNDPRTTGVVGNGTYEDAAALAKTPLEIIAFPTHVTCRN